MSPSRTPPARLAAVYESYAAASHGSSQSQHGFAPLTAPHLQAFVHNDQSAGRPRPGDISRKASYCSLTSAVTIPLADEGYSGRCVDKSSYRRIIFFFPLSHLRLNMARV
jgi:hypothetical protein